MENLRNSSNKIGRKKGNFSKFAPILAGALFLMNPSGIEAQNVPNKTRAKTEVSTSTILDRLDKKIGISLPDEYNQKVLDFVLNDTIMRTRSATAYTEEFIINEMKKDRGINKQNQLLFIRSSIYEGISQKKLYDILNDENDNRYDEYEKASELIDLSYEEYKKGFKTYMEVKSAEYDKRSAEYDRRSAEADRRSAEADRRSAEADRIIADAERRIQQLEKEINEIKGNITRDSNCGLQNLNDLYYIYKNNSNNLSQEEIKNIKKLGFDFINLCKQHSIDYKAKLSPEVRKFYGID